MANKNEVALFNSCVYMLQVHQAVSFTGKHHSWFAANTTFTAISVILTCFVMYSMFQTKQVFRSPLMPLFIYVCLNDLLFALMGELKYSIIHFDIDIPCYVFVIFYFFTEFAHSKQ